MREVPNAAREGFVDSWIGCVATVLILLSSPLSFAFSCKMCFARSLSSVEVFAFRVVGCDGGGFVGFAG
jgi:hypothetical protein